MKEGRSKARETRGINSDERGLRRPMRRASVYSVLRSTTTHRDQVFMLRQPGAPRTPGCAPPTGGGVGVRVEARREWRWGGVEGVDEWRDVDGTIRRDET